MSPCSTLPHGKGLLLWKKLDGQLEGLWNFIPKIRGIDSHRKLTSNWHDSSIRVAHRFAPRIMQPSTPSAMTGWVRFHSSSEALDKCHHGTIISKSLDIPLINGIFSHWPAGKA